MSAPSSSVSQSLGPEVGQGRYREELISLLRGQGSTFNPEAHCQFLTTLKPQVTAITSCHSNTGEGALQPFPHPNPSQQQLRNPRTYVMVQKMLESEG